MCRFLNVCLCDVNSTASGLVCRVRIIKAVSLSLIIKSSLSWWKPEEGDGVSEQARERDHS